MCQRCVPPKLAFWYQGLMQKRRKNTDVITKPLFGKFKANCHPFPMTCKLIENSYQWTYTWGPIQHSLIQKHFWSLNVLGISWCNSKSLCFRIRWTLVQVLLLSLTSCMTFGNFLLIIGLGFLFYKMVIIYFYLFIYLFV